jgi:hypothetical protein
MTVIHEPGIYFGLSAESYHADPALGSTAIKELASDPYDFQYKRLHGEDKDTKALIWGSALHTRVLDGKEAFDRRYAIAPKREDHPDALDTMDDLRAHAKSIGVKAGRTKAETIANIREFDNRTPIWEEIVQAFTAASAGKIILDAEVRDEVEQAAQWMQRDPMLSPVMQNGQIISGASEVSIFYEDNGVRLKCRLDRLLPHGIIDIKSFRPSVGWSTAPRSLNRVLGRVIAQMRYDIQAADYIRGFRKAASLVAKGRVFGGSDIDHALLEKAIARDDLKWIWVLVKNAVAPQPFVREFPLKLTTFGAAMGEVEEAIETYRRLRDEFGDDEDWTPRHPADAFDDSDFPVWIGM